MDANRKRKGKRSGKSSRAGWSETLEKRIGLHADVDPTAGGFSPEDWADEAGEDAKPDPKRAILFRPRRGRVNRRRTLLPIRGVSHDGRTFVATAITQGGHST